MREERPRINLREIDSLPPPVTARLPKFLWSSLPSFPRLTRSLRPKSNDDPLPTPNSHYSTLFAQAYTTLYSRLRSTTPSAKLSTSTRTTNATWLSMIWNTAPTHQRRPSNEPATTPLANLTTKFDNQRKRFALSRRGFLLVLLLLFLGLRDLLLRSSHRPSTSSNPSTLKIKGRDPFVVLKDFTPAVVHPLGALASFDKLWKQDTQSVEGYDTALGVGDTTAIVLNWKRTENVVVIVAALCQYSFFETVLVWNNNPQLYLSRETFAAAKCPASKLRIYNSPRNLYFFARYLACAQASTPNCFFQDDDWLVRPLRALYSQFSRDTEGPPVVHTNPNVANLYGWEWCFFNAPMHTCFAWVGTGAFVARSRVLSFLDTTSEFAYGREELSHADNSFTTLQNDPPIVLSGELVNLPQPFGHSDGEGIARNKLYIERGIERLASSLGPLTSPRTASLPAALKIDTSLHRPAENSSLLPHPYAHHARSPCTSDTCLFLTNIPLLPPPDAVVFPGIGKFSLEEWENHLGTEGRGWIEGGEIWAEGEEWARRWGYAGAVDGRFDTAFRSLDHVKADDYIALGLLKTIDAQWIQKVRLNFILEDVEAIAPGLIIEVSTDGYEWLPPLADNLGNYPLPTCVLTPHHSLAPSPSFPSTYLTTHSTSTFLYSEKSLEETSSLIGRWWRRRRKLFRRLSVCSTEINTRFEGEERGGGWRFVRLRSENDVERVGWGVYEMWID